MEQIIYIYICLMFWSLEDIYWSDFEDNLLQPWEAVDEVLTYGHLPNTFFYAFTAPLLPFAFVFCLCFPMFFAFKVVSYLISLFHPSEADKGTCSSFAPIMCCAVSLLKRRWGAVWARRFAFFDFAVAKHCDFLQYQSKTEMACVILQQVNV